MIPTCRSSLDSLVYFSVLPSSENAETFDSFTVSFAGLNTNQADLILLKTYTERLRSRIDDASDTAYFTLALAESFWETCLALQEGKFDDLHRPLTRLQRLSSHGLKVEERWQRQGFLDIHSKLYFVKSIK